MHSKFYSESLEGRDHSEDLSIDKKIIFVIHEWILGRQGGKLWIGYILLRTGTSGGLL
jgi:hypothetical protein